MAEGKVIFRARDAKAGDTIGTLLLLSKEAIGRRFHWQCRCVTCGRERPVRMDHLERYVGQPCRCHPHRTHGHSREREWKIWCKMIARCHDPRMDNFKYYGAIGRYVCPRFREDYEAFIADVGPAPSKEHTLDRENSEGSYTCGKCDHCKEHGQPANVRWATKYQQVRNATNNRYYTHDGKTLILKDWARLVGLDYHALFTRIERGWTFERAIATPKLTTWNRRPKK